MIHFMLFNFQWNRGWKKKNEAGKRLHPWQLNSAPAAIQIMNVEGIFKNNR